MNGIQQTTLRLINKKRADWDLPAIESLDEVDAIMVEDYEDEVKAVVKMVEHQIKSLEDEVEYWCNKWVKAVARPVPVL